MRLGAGFWLVEVGSFQLGGSFMIIFKYFEMVIEGVVRLVWRCSNKRALFLRRLSLTSMVANLSNVDVRLLGMVM